MMYKKKKEDILIDARYAAQAAASGSLSNLAYNYGNSSPQQNLSQIGIAIGQAVEAALKVMIEAQYTDEEFETDLGLRNGPL